MNRREFIRTTVFSSASASLVHARQPESRDPIAAYVGSVNSIDVWRVTVGDWELTQRYPSSRPLSLVLHPNRKFLFAANDIQEYRGIPTGSVESYAIGSEGQLSLISRRSLSLSAIRPGQLAVTPDGHHLLVAVYGGGAYNVFSVSEAGEIGELTQILKHIGRGPDPLRQASAHPHSLALHPDGKTIFGTDSGSDRINVFRCGNGELCRVHSVEISPGSGPAQIAIHPSGSLLFTLGELDAVLSCCRFDPITERLNLINVVSLHAGHALALHPSGEFLYSAGHSPSESLTAWQIDQKHGKLRLLDSFKGQPARSVTLTADGHHLFCLLGENPAVLATIRIHPTTGRFDGVSMLANLESSLSLALLHS